MGWFTKKAPEVKTTDFTVAWECPCGEFIRNWRLQASIPIKGVCSACGRLTKDAKLVTGKWTYIDSDPVQYISFALAHRY